MSKAFFVTGTDTNIGKTWSTVALMLAMQQKGKVVTAMKPVAAGCDWMQGGWRNQDAILLQRYASLALDYAVINPYAFEPAVSPHVACADVEVELSCIQARFSRLREFSDCVLVEGAGGWFSPISRDLDNADLAGLLRLPVILVVGVRLGCINHALLTYQAILQKGLECAGWIAVQLECDMPAVAENLDFLKAKIRAPLLGVLPYQAQPKFALLAHTLQMSNLGFY